MTFRPLLCLVLVCAVTLTTATARAGEKNLGKFGAWRAYSSNEGGQKVCYMATTQLVRSTQPQKRGTPYLMITHRPTEASTDVVSYGAGMMLNTRNGVELKTGKGKFEMFSVRDTAWARDAMTDHRMVAAFLTNPTAQITTQPDKKKARRVTDIFALTGAKDAYHAINKACGVAGVVGKPQPAAHTKPAKIKKRPKPKS